MNMPKVDERLRYLVHAYLRHEGYTDEEIRVAELMTHGESGCMPTSYGWDCRHPETDESLHPMMDRLNEVAEMVRVIVEADAARPTSA